MTEVPYHPSALLFHDPALAVAIARIHPLLHRWLVRESRLHYRQNMQWLRYLDLAYRVWELEPTTIVIKAAEESSGESSADR